MKLKVVFKESLYKLIRVMITVMLTIYDRDVSISASVKQFSRWIAKNWVIATLQTKVLIGIVLRWFYELNGYLIYKYGS